jgi:uncharacterized protein
MKDCNLPTRQQCFELMEEFHVPAHIKDHSLAVAKLGVFLARKLRAKSVAVNVDLVDRACLLHDILRVLDFYEPDHDQFQQAVTDQHEASWRQLRDRHKSTCHEDAAYELLRQRYPALAVTVRRHKYTALLDEKEKPETWEEKLVYYADKRVMRDKIVPLRDRLEEAHQRHAHLRETRAGRKVDTAKVDLLIFELETEIFGKIGLDPIQVTDELVQLSLSKMEAGG